MSEETAKQPVSRHNSIPLPTCRPLSALGERPRFGREPRPPSSDLDVPAGWPIFAVRSEAQSILELAWVCFQDVASCRHLRRPGLTTNYRSAGNAETRLVAQLDAIVACGAEAVSACFERVKSCELPEPDLWFAATLLAGWISHPSALHEALALLRLSATLEQPLVQAVVEGFCLMPHPGASAAAASAVSDQHPIVRAAALRIISERHTLEPTLVLQGLGDTDPDVLVAALEGLATLPRSMAPPSLPRLLNHADLRAAAAALRALVRHDHPNARHFAEEWCKTPGCDPSDGVWALALLGVRSDVRIVQQQLVANPSAELILASGWFGHSDLVPTLIALLGSNDAALCNSAAAALQRLTGAGLTEKLSAPADPWAEKLREQSGKRFYKTELAAWEITQISTEAPVWEYWWQQHAKRFSPLTRVRWGQPLGVMERIDALEQGPGDTKERDHIAIELAILAGDKAPFFSPRGWVRVQESAIAAWRHWAQANPSPQTAGSWRG